MLERLNTEEQLSKYAGWFIPLKIDSNSDAWQEWAKTYTHEGNSIPIVYVIRADGEMLYGKSGSLPGEELYQLLNSSLNSAGIQLSEQQLASVGQTVKRANEFMTNHEPQLAVKELMRLSKLGPVGEIDSYAAIVSDANFLVRQLNNEALSILGKAVLKTDIEATRFEGMMNVVDCNEVYGRLPLINKEIKKLRSEWSRDDALKQTSREVKQYRRLLKQTDSGKLVRKLSAIREFMDKNSDQDALVQRAVTLLDGIVVEALELEPDELIDWVAKSGHKISGKLRAKVEDGKVSIETENGQVKTVSLNQLDEVSNAIAELQVE